MRAEHEGELAALHTALSDLDFLTIAARGRDGAIRLSPLDAVAEPRNLGLVKRSVVQRWGMVPLVDAVKEAVLRSNCRATIAGMTGRDARADRNEQDRVRPNRAQVSRARAAHRTATAVGHGVV